MHSVDGLPNQASVSDGTIDITLLANRAEETWDPTSSGMIPTSITSAILEWKTF